MLQVHPIVTLRHLLRKPGLPHASSFPLLAPRLGAVLFPGALAPRAPEASLSSFYLQTLLAFDLPAPSMLTGRARPPSCRLEN